MYSLTHYLEDLQSTGRSTFTRDEAISEIPHSDKAFSAAITRLIKKRRLISPRRGFYVILRPEDKKTGAPDPIRWIDPLMQYLNLDYRVSLLRAAAFHGASHQASMVFQVIVPKQIRSLETGSYRIQFIYQTAPVFEKLNQISWLEKMKSGTGYTCVADLELLLFDAIRYQRKTGGLNGVAQIVYDLGKKASPRKLAKLAEYSENTTVRRLGYLFDCFGFERQAKVLAPFAEKAKSMKLLNPSILSLSEELKTQDEQNNKWMLIINDTLEIDS